MTATAKTIWLSGASSGIGRALALELCLAGHRVIACARRHSLLADLALEAETKSLTGKIIPYALDVTDRTAHQDCIAELERDIGPIDLVICNAGYYQPTPVENYDAAVVLNMMDINFNSVIYMLEAILPRMRKRGTGQVAIVASVAGYSGLPNASAYGASKAALINLAESLHMDLARAGVLVQVINPGFVQTPLTEQNKFKMPFLIPAEAAAKHIVRGLNTGKFEICFPKSFAWLLKFLRLLPYALYFRLVRNFR